jgi:hypothetical protein
MSKKPHYPPIESIDSAAQNEEPEFASFLQPEDPEPAPAAELAAPAAIARQDGGMVYLGALYPHEAVNGGGRSTGLAGLPIIVKVNGEIAGVVVVSDPGYTGAALNTNLERAGLAGPFEQVPPMSLSPQQRLAAARAIVEERDPAVNLTAVLAALGLTLADLGF